MDPSTIYNGRWAISSLFVMRCVRCVDRIESGTVLATVFAYVNQWHSTEYARGSK
jgi:hypothetical protein